VPTLPATTFGPHTLLLVVKDTTGISYSSTFNFSVTNNLPSVTGLVGEWLLANGNTSDTSGSGNNATSDTTNGSMTPGDDHFGLLNGATDFSGGYGYRAGEITPPTDSFTWSLWFKYSSDGAMLITQGDAPGAGGNARSISVDATTHYLDFYMFHAAGVWVNVQTSSQVAQNVWHLATGVYDGTYASLYLDGDFVGKQPFNLGTNGGTTFYLGEQASYSSFGSVDSLDHVRIYSRALTAAEVNAVYHEGGY
jgi:hypothetical protein